MLVKHLIDKGIATKINWICRHADLFQNELPDHEAKSAAQRAFEWKQSPVLVTAKQSLGNIWCRNGRISDIMPQKARKLDNIHPEVELTPKPHWWICLVETKLNRLKYGYSWLNGHHYLHGKLVESPKCQCRQTGNIYTTTCWSGSSTQMK